MNSLLIYDGSNDIKAVETNHTVSAVSCNQIANLTRNSMTLRKNGREDWSLFFCESGQIYFEDSILRAGEIWIYEPHVPQRYTIFHKDSTVYRYLHFTGTDVGNIFSSLNIPYSTPIKPRNKINAKLFNEIKLNICNNDAVSNIRSECLILRLIMQLSDVRPQKTEINIMKHVTETMSHSLSENYDAKKYADMLHISEGRFNHIFKEVMGVSPHLYYTKLRIDNACRLLKDTDLKIKEISEYSGYSDSLYFTQVFKKQKGITPSGYRRLNKCEL